MGRFWVQRSKLGQVAIPVWMAPTLSFLAGVTWWPRLRATWLQRCLESRKQVCSQLSTSRERAGHIPQQAPPVLVMATGPEEKPKEGLSSGLVLVSCPPLGGKALPTLQPGQKPQQCAKLTLTCAHTSAYHLWLLPLTDALLARLCRSQGHLPGSAPL